MGGASSSWYDKTKRKVIILSFENIFITRKSLLNKEIKVNDHIGFHSDEMKHRLLNIKLWFLTTKHRHLWRHHYYGAQGVILLFSFKDVIVGSRLIIEVLNVFEDTNLKNVPILIVFDKQNEDMQMINEKLRSLINLKDNLNINILHANFNQLETDMKLGLDWLCEVMKPIPE